MVSGNTEKQITNKFALKKNQTPYPFPQKTNQPTKRKNNKKTTPPQTEDNKMINRAKINFLKKDSVKPF